MTAFWTALTTSLAAATPTPTWNERGVGRRSGQSA
jgi:hypothetical protein